MTFELQVGDWIPKSEIPEDKRKAVVDVFAKAGFAPHIRFDTYWEQDRYDLVIAEETELMPSGKMCGFISSMVLSKMLKRRVTLDQILGTQEQAMTFKLQQGDYVQASDITSEEMHNRIRSAFIKAGARDVRLLGNYISPTNRLYPDRLGWNDHGDLCWLGGIAGKRRVYPSQILSNITETRKFTIDQSVSGNKITIEPVGELVEITYNERKASCVFKDDLSDIITVLQRIERGE